MTMTAQAQEMAVLSLIEENRAECRDCQSEIFFATTARGKRIALDRRPVKLGKRYTLQAHKSQLRAFFELKNVGTIGYPAHKEVCGKQEDPVIAPQAPINHVRVETQQDWQLLLLRSHLKEMHAGYNHPGAGVVGTAWDSLPDLEAAHARLHLSVTDHTHPEG